MAEVTDKTLLTVGGFSEVTGIPKITIRRWARRGLISCRFDSSGKRIFGPEDVKKAAAIRNRGTYYHASPKK